jgi:hypothetical protein
VLVQFGALDDGRPFIQQPGQGAEEARLALAALAEQDDIVSRNERAFELGKHSPAEAVHPRPRIPAGGERGEQVSADFLPQVLEDVAGCTQFTNSEDIGTISHPYTVAPDQPRNRGIFSIPPFPGLLQRLRWITMTAATPSDLPAPPAGRPVAEEAGLLECDVGEWTGAALADLTGLPHGPAHAVVVPFSGRGKLHGDAGTHGGRP